MRTDRFNQILNVGDLVVIPKTGGSSPRPKVGIVVGFTKAYTRSVELVDWFVPYIINGKVEIYTTNSGDGNYIKLSPNILAVEEHQLYQQFRTALGV